MTLAILCSGQGPQHAGMFALTGDAPQAAALFDHAATLLDGRDPRAIVRTDTDAQLHNNRVGQILCTLQPLAAASLLLDRASDTLPAALCVAGYSVGEVAAWGVAGRFSGQQTLDLVARRAAAMDAASVPGDGLLFVRGLSRDVLDRLCATHAVEIAIVNPGDAYVLGGAGEALDALAAQAGEAGATRVVRVAVSVASHTSRMAAAARHFRDALGDVTPAAQPRRATRLFSGIDGSAVLNVKQGLDKLAAQIAQTIQWSACLEGCVEAGASAFLELGPGRALSEMAASAYPHLPARSLDDFRTVEGLDKWMTALR